MRNVLLAFLVCLLSQTAFAQCAASFTYTTSGLTATFTNTSTPTTPPSNGYLYRDIKYGSAGPYAFNGTTSYTFPTAGTYLVVASVSYLDSNTMVFCHDQDSQMVTVNYGPCAVSISKTQVGNTVTFTANNLSSTPGMTYNWTFGDGGTGTGSPVTHTYTTSGTYGVSLVGSSTTASCSKTDSSVVFIQQSKLEGYVIGDSLSADTFKVWLIKFDSTTNILSAVDSLICSNTITSMAMFSFANPPVGTYRLKAAQLDGPTSGTGKVPTYHTSSLY
jgi:PKD repeat protein